MLAGNPADAHRPIGPDHDLASSLSRVESRRVANDYTIRYQGKLYQIAQSGTRPSRRGGAVRVELRLDRSLAVRFGKIWLEVSECHMRTKTTPVASPKAASASASTKAQRTAAWRHSNANLFKPGISVAAAATINRARTRDTLD